MPLGVREQKVLLIDSETSDWSADGHGSWKCVNCKTVLLTKDTLTTVNKPTYINDPFYMRVRKGKAWRRVYVDGSKLYLCQRYAYENRSNSNFMRTVLKLIDRETKVTFPIFVRYSLRDNRLPNDHTIKKHGYSKGDIPFHPSSKSPLAEIKEHVSQPNANVAKV